MSQDVSFKEVLDHINSSYDDSRSNSHVGLFVSEYYEDKTIEIDNFVVKKPLVVISSFVEDNDIFYNVRFVFKSFNDADYKQMWKFICRFAEKSKVEGKRLVQNEVLEKVLGLSVSIVPEKYSGKYFAYISLPYTETISRTENAFDGSAEISLVCEEGSFAILSSDDDVIDPRSIAQEVDQEILASGEV